MKTTQEATLEALRNAYGPLTPETEYSDIVERVVAILDDVQKSVAVYVGAVTPAAYETNMLIWGTLTQHPAAAATADIFHMLGRETELGWLMDETPEYTFKGA